MVGMQHGDQLLSNHTCLQKDQPIPEVIVQVVNEGVHPQAVHPVAEGLLLPSLLNDLHLHWLQSRVAVEQVGHVGQVETSMATHHVLRSGVVV